MTTHPSPTPPDGPTSIFPGSEGVYRVIFTEAFEAMAISDNGAIVDFNEAALRTFGYTRQEILGTPLATLVAPESRPAVALAIGTGSKALYELIFLHKDGSRFEAEAEAKVLLIGGRALRLTVLRDITARRQSAESLQGSQAKLQIALAMARLGQWELDLATQQFTFDDNFLRLLGTTVEREGGYTMAAETYARRFIPPEEMVVVGRETASAVATADPTYQKQIEHRFLRADGTSGHMLVHIAVVKDATGRTIRTYGINQDITQQRLAEQQRIHLEEQLQQAHKMEALGTLAGGIAHDFNNILTGILGHLQLVELSIPPNHLARQGLSEATKAGRRARELVARILAFSRHSQHDRKPLPLGPIIQEALQLLRASLPATIEMRPAISPDCPPVLCDAAQLHQIIINLATNAAHAMKERGGVLTVDLSRVAPTAAFRKKHPQVNAHHTVRLSVRDTGCGMDEAVLKRIFEPFYTTKSTGEGTGIGLTIVYSIILDHAGAIVVESTPGKGSVFDLYLAPALEASPPAKQSASPLPTGTLPFGRGRHLMLVDDDEAVRSVGEHMLKRLGFVPIVFSSPLAALAAFRKSPTDACAVVSDLTMPGMTGIELARQLAAIRPGIPLVLISGFLDNRTQGELRTAGVQHVINKPFELEDIAGKLRAALDEPAPAA